MFFIQSAQIILRFTLSFMMSYIGLSVVTYAVFAY
jgi:hypothetical protein